MIHSRSTFVPNFIFDEVLRTLTEAELKVLLIVVRQTLGWKGKDGGRKQRDRISGSQFREKTGLSKRVVTLAIGKLCQKGLMQVTDFYGGKVNTAGERKGRTYLFYSAVLPAHNPAPSKALSAPAPAQNWDHNKRKEKKAGQRPARDFPAHIGTLIAGKELYGGVQQT